LYYSVVEQWKEDIEKVTGHLLSFIAVPGIERRLAAAGLCFRKAHFHTALLEESNRSYTDIGVQQIYHTGYEESDAATWFVSFKRHRCVTPHV
jgi:hypothetical protein